MTLKRYYTKSMFTEAIEVGDIQPFDYLQPEGQLSIDAVYIGTKSNGTHWVCWSMSYSDTEAVGLKYLIKMAEAFLGPAPCSRHELGRFDQFRSIAEDINARAKDKAAKAEAIAGARKDIDDALGELVDATEIAYDIRAQHQVMHEDADLDQHEVRLDALKEVKRVLDKLTKVTDNGGRPAITDRIRYHQLIDDSIKSGGIVKQEIDSGDTYNIFNHG